MRKIRIFFLRVTHMAVFIKECRHTVKTGYNELGYNEQIFQIGQSSTQINPVTTNPGYNEQKFLVPTCSL